MDKERAMTYDAVLGWRLMPNVEKMYSGEEIPYLVCTNSKGLRDKEHAYQNPASSQRVVVLGDSFVFGTGGVDNEALFTEVLEGCIPASEVINMGVPAYSLDQEYLLFASEGMKYHPDLVVLCLFANDFEDTFVFYNTAIGRPKGAVSLEAETLKFHPPTMSFFYKQSHYSYILGWIEHRFKVFSKEGIDNNADLILNSADKKKIFKRLLTSLISISRNNGSDICLVYFPVENQSKKNGIQEILEDLRETENVSYIDFMDVFKNTPMEKSPYFERDIHFNQQGHQVVANTLCDLMKQISVKKDS